jgi:DNA-binding MarR family transcriptional regulator
MKKDKIIDSLVPLMLIVGRRIRENHGCKHGSHRYSFGQIETLKYLNEHKTPLMKDVADYLHITRPTATTLINSLVKSGNIKRIVDAKDRRAIKLEITQQGKRELKKTFTLMTKRSRDVLGKLSEVECNHLIEIFKKLERIYQ